MYCTKCGQQVQPGAAFCANCGNQVGAVGAPQTSPQGAPQSEPYVYAPAVGHAAPKKKTGLIIGLSVGGAVLIAGVVLLIVLLGGGGSAVLGTWYETSGYGGTITFNGNGSFDIRTMGFGLSGKYTYNDAQRTGEMMVTAGDFGDPLDADDYGTMTLYLKGDSLYFEGSKYTRNYVEQNSIYDMFEGFDYDDFDLGDFNYDDFDLDDFNF